MTATARPRIGISLGDPSGIGLEVTLKALARPAVKRALTPVLFGDASVRAPGLESRLHEVLQRLREEWNP